MNRMKTFLKYALWIIVFFIFSEIVIYIGLNSSYKNIERRDKTEQVQMEQAQATLVNGRMKGKIIASNDDYLTGKYVKIEFYSKRNIKLGTKYIEINTNEANKTQDFSAYFELKDVKSYEISIVDKKDTDEIKLISREWTKAEVLWVTICTMIMFW